MNFHAQKIYLFIFSMLWSFFTMKYTKKKLYHAQSVSLHVVGLFGFASMVHVGNCTIKMCWNSRQSEENMTTRQGVIVKSKSRSRTNENRREKWRKLSTSMYEQSIDDILFCGLDLFISVSFNNPLLWYNSMKSERGCVRHRKNIILWLWTIQSKLIFNFLKAF